MFNVYILRSQKDGKYYIGRTKDLVQRIEAHNRGSVKSTKNRRPLELVYSEEFKTIEASAKREIEIKKYKDTARFLSYRKR